jgi:DNA-binding winged helix-turn-helix (wHTH) protein/tetratricopeptide (TPR) repeat protein
MDLVFPPFRLDALNERLQRGEDVLTLRAKPFAMLRYLAEHPGRLITHDEMRKAIWPATHVSEGILRVYLREVRAALNDDAESPRFVETIPRRGYRFIAQVERRQAQAEQIPRRIIPQKTQLVGRIPELGALLSSFDKASQGTRQMVFLRGEAGIGKSALLDALFAEIGPRDDVWFGRGQCVEQHGDSEPYLPMLDALRQFCRQDGGPQVIELLRKHAPTWLAQMPSVADDAWFEEAQRKAAGAGQQRMLREMAEALEQLANYRIVVLACEDLHWSDPSTLTLLDLLARRVEPARLLLVGTHRPISSTPDGHPLRTLVSELSGRYCSDLSPSALTAGEVAEYLEQRLEIADSDKIAAAGLARTIHHRSEGNPLFMVTMVTALLGGENGSAAPGNGSSIELMLERSERIVPTSTREMIEHQFAQLDRADQALLEIASVAGVEFSAAALAAASGEDISSVEQRCAALVNRASLIRDFGDSEWPDGTVAGKFRFSHALCWETVYNRLTAVRRAQLHLQIGAREEAAYAGRTEQVAADLARHFEQARDFSRVITYRKQAARNALKQSAPSEATQHLNAALRAIERLPEGPERTQNELDCQLALGAALQSTIGYGAAEVQQSYERAGDLCRRLGETQQLFPSLMGIWSYSVGRGEWPRGRELAERNLRLAERIQEPAPIARSRRALGHCLFFLGRLEEARENLQQAVSLTEQPYHPPLDEFTYTTNTGVDARSALSWTLELLGYPDQALVAIRQAHALAERIGNMHDLAYASFFAAVLYGFRTEWRTAEGWSRRTVELATEHGLPYYVTMGTHMSGAAAAAQDKTGEGIEMMRSAIGTSLAMGVESGISAMHLMIAVAALEAGHVREGLDAIRDAFDFVNAKDERAWEPELLRVRGELLLEQFRHGQGIRGVKRGDRDAEECFISARELAIAQRARKWELRSALSLSDLYRRQRKRKESRQVLSESYNKFTEGFETPELKTTRRLLTELGADAT